MTYSRHTMPRRADGSGDRVSTGIPGLDDVLGGSLPRHRALSSRGLARHGKTTLALQFLLDGPAPGRARHASSRFPRARSELRASAASHNWSLDGISVMELMTDRTSLEQGADPAPPRRVRTRGDH